MTFTVTYRSATGALCEVCVEAASRADCLAQMKARGLAPVRVREGAARNGRRLAPNPGMAGDESTVAHGRGRREGEGGAGAKSPSVPSKALLAAVCALALAVGGGVWWWLHSGRAVEAPERPPRKPAVAQPKPAKPAAVSLPTNAVVTSTVAVESMAPSLSDDLYLGRKVVSRQSVTNANGSSYDILRTEDGKTHRVNVKSPGKGRRLFKYSTDILLAQAVGTPGNGDMPPMLFDSDLDEQFIRSLKEPIEFEEADTVEERKLKETVMLAREDVKDLMKTGTTFTEIIREHQALAAENSEIRRRVALEAKRLRESHGAEEAREYLSKMNAALGRMGIAPLTRTGANPRRRQPAADHGKQTK